MHLPGTLPGTNHMWSKAIRSTLIQFFWVCWHSLLAKDHFKVWLDLSAFPDEYKVHYHIIPFITWDTNPELLSFCRAPRSPILGIISFSNALVVSAFLSILEGNAYIWNCLVLSAWQWDQSANLLEDVSLWSKKFKIVPFLSSKAWVKAISSAFWADVPKARLLLLRLGSGRLLLILSAFFPPISGPFLFWCVGEPHFLGQGNWNRLCLLFLYNHVSRALYL